MKINADALAGLDKSALIDLLVQALAEDTVQEPTPEPTLGTCGSTLTISGDPCGTKTKGGRDCGRHGTKAEVEAKRAKQEEFLAKRRTYAEKANSKEAKATKEGNRLLAAEIRKAGGTPNGDTWAEAKRLLALGTRFDRAAQQAVKAAA